MADMDPWMANYIRLVEHDRLGGIVYGFFQGRLVKITEKELDCRSVFLGPVRPGAIMEDCDDGEIPAPDLANEAQVGAIVAPAINEAEGQVPRRRRRRQKQEMGRVGSSQHDDDLREGCYQFPPQPKKEKGRKNNKEKKMLQPQGAKKKVAKGHREQEKGDEKEKRAKDKMEREKRAEKREKMAEERNERAKEAESDEEERAVVSPEELARRRKFSAYLNAKKAAKKMHRGGKKKKEEEGGDK